MSLYHLLEDGHPTDEVWAVDHRQPIYLPFTRRITSTKSWPPYVKALMQSCTSAGGRWQNPAENCFLFSLFSLLLFFTRPVYIYLWPIPASWFFGDSINSNSRSFSLTLFLYPDIFYFLFVTNIFAFIGVVWWKIFVFLTRKKKYPDLYVSLFYLTFRIGLENQTKSWLQAVYILSGLNSLWFSRELGSNYKHRGSLT